MRLQQSARTSLAPSLRPGLRMMMWTAPLASHAAGIPLAVLAFAGGWLVEYVSMSAPACRCKVAAGDPYLDESTAAVLG
jgi:hypothetical protein